MEKAQVLALVSNLVVKAAGKALKDGDFLKQAEKGGTFGVFPVKGTAATVLPGHEIIAALKAQFPQSAFTFFAKAVEKAVEDAEPSGGKEKK